MSSSLVASSLPKFRNTAGGVIAEHGHADALGSDLEVAVERHDLALLGVHMTEHLERFLLGLRFLTGDERDDVAHHLGPILEGLARAGNRLVSAHNHLARLEFLPRGQRRRVGLNREFGLTTINHEWCLRCVGARWCLRLIRTTIGTSGKIQRWALCCWRPHRGLQRSGDHRVSVLA